MYDSVYGLAIRSTHPRLTQRTVKTGISIYQPRRSSNAACSPRNDSLLRTALALQHLAYVRLDVRASNQIDTPRLTQRTVKTGTSIYHSTTRPTSASRTTDLSFPHDRPQLPASNIQLRTSTTRPYQLSTSPI